MTATGWAQAAASQRYGEIRHRIRLIVVFPFAIAAVCLIPGLALGDGDALLLGFAILCTAIALAVGYAWRTIMRLTRATALVAWLEDRGLIDQSATGGDRGLTDVEREVLQAYVDARVLAADGGDWWGLLADTQRKHRLKPAVVPRLTGRRQPLVISRWAWLLIGPLAAIGLLLLLGAIATGFGQALGL